MAQLEEIMEEMQEPFQMPIPFGLVGDSNLPVAADMIPVQEETKETQELVMRLSQWRLSSENWSMLRDHWRQQ